MNMNAFKEAYLRVIGRCRSVSDAEPSSFEIDADVRLIAEGVTKIIDEYVKDPAFTPVPKELLDYVCSMSPLKKPGIASVPFKEICKKLKDFDYEYFNEFKTNLESRSLLDGKLFIMTAYGIDDSDVYPAFNRTYNAINSAVKDIDASFKLFETLKRMKDADAFCTVEDSSDPLAGFFNGNAFIFVSLFAEFKKDSLEHELTHFVQRIVGFDKSLKKSYTSAEFNSFMTKDIEKAKALSELSKTMTDSADGVSMLMGFFASKFNSRELDQTIKAILNGFQRIYEEDRLDFVSPQLEFDRHKKNRAESRGDRTLRMRWLSDFIRIVNEPAFVRDYVKPCLKSNSYDNEFFRKNRVIFIVVAYLGFKKMFSFSIDDALVDHFKSFKFRDD